jgi:DNA-binding NarL/FixJ family response regulator
MTRVMVVDDEILFRVGVRQALGHQDDVVIHDCHRHPNLMQAVSEFLPDVILLGCELGDRIGLSLAREISLVHPDIRIIIISHDPHDEERFRIIKGAITNCLSKNTCPEALSEMIKRVSPSEQPVPQSFLDSAPLTSLPASDTEQPPILTRNRNPKGVLSYRERQILTCISEGNTNKEIAQLLGVSEQTVKTHVSAILRKLSAHDRAHAVALALQSVPELN